MHIDLNAKYAAWFFSGSPVADDWPTDTTIAEGSFAARDLGIQVADHWSKWLGSFVVDDIAAGGIALYVTSPSKAPAILDGENEELKRRCNDLLYGLTIQGVPSYQRSVAVTGAHVDGVVQVRQYSAGREMIPTYELEFVPGRVHAERAGRIAARLRQMQDAKGTSWSRLLRVTQVLLEANRTGNSHGERFHQFVRVLDGLAKTRPGRGAADFVERVQTFVLASAETTATLLEIYDIRGAVEHVNSPLDRIPSSGKGSSKAVESARVNRLNQLTRQLDVLVRCVLVQILENEKTFELFRTDESIDAFWGLEDAERVATWGDRIDIGRVE